MATNALKSLLVGAAYYASGVLGLQLALVETNVSPLWPPTGIAVAGFLRLGVGVWPGVAVAAFLINLPISTTPVAAAATAVGNTLAPLVAATLLRRVGFRSRIDRLRDALAIVVIGVGSMAVSATIGAGTLVVTEAIAASAFPGAWTVWWTGDAMGVLAVAPFLLTLRRPRWDRTTPVLRRVEALVLIAAVALVSYVIFASGSTLRFLVFPLLGWAAWRFQQPVAAPSALIVMTMAAWSAGRGTGSFGSGPVVETMLTLQAFNATVAFVSLFLAALVSERGRVRETLERSAEELEQRVADRTSELQHRERQLAEAQHVARIGSWEWSVRDDAVSWSDEMFRIHGHPPQAFAVNFWRAIQQIVPEDRDRTLRALEEAISERRTRDLPALEYRIVRPDRQERTLVARSRLQVDEESGDPVRMIGTVQDITETRRAEREHRIAETLQRSLLPDRLPDVPGLRLAVRYLPATAESDLGGDWYDVFEIPNRRVAVVVGDIVGHGLRAASAMAQVRMALRAYATEDSAPASVIERASRLFERLGIAEMATLLYGVLDLETGEMIFANAGHPPPLLVDRAGHSRFVEGGLVPPLGAIPGGQRFDEVRARVAFRETLLLFTDGLVERRGASLHEGLERLREAVRQAPKDPESLCDHLLASLVGTSADDDVALLAVSLVSRPEEPLRLDLPADPRALGTLRRAARGWLRAAEADEDAAYDVLLACNEACTNVIRHAYGDVSGEMEVRLERVDGSIAVTVRDRGRWREPSHQTDGGRGRGLTLMRGLMDEVEIEPSADGTEVRMRRRVEGVRDETQPHAGTAPR